MQLTFQR